MARGGKKEENAEANPEVEERRRLKKLAIKNKMLSEGPSRVASSAALSPSKTVLKHQGKDILRKSQRKNRFLFSFPGLLGPVSGGKIGELKNLGSKNPILYLDFPQGQMKLFGTIVYPKNRYLTLQFSRGGKNVMCEDYFDNMVVFSEAWWIGKRDENPEELQLKFPEELNMGQCAESDFKGGAGAICDENKGVRKITNQQSAKRELDGDSSGSQGYLKEVTEVTAERHSARSAGKIFKFAEVSSGDDLIDDGADTYEEEEKVDTIHRFTTPTAKKKENSGKRVFDVDKEEDTEPTSYTEKIKQTSKSNSKVKDVTKSNQGSLFQATISTLFKKVENKVGEKKGTTSEGKQGAETGMQEGKTELEDDDIEEFSSSSQDMDASDEDWAA